MRYLFLSICLISSALFAQDRYGNKQLGVFNNNMDFFAMAKVNNKSNTNYLPGVKGSPYLFSEWNKCKIYPSDDTPNFVIPCNYNIYSDQFEIKVGDDLYVLNPQSVNTLIADQDTFIPNKSMTGNEFFELLGSNEHIKLVRVYKAKILSVQTSTLGLHESKLKISSTDYFLMNDGKLVKLPSSKSKIFDILNLTNAQRKDFKSYNLKQTDQLVNLLQSI
ncbi:MAG: hypothetical protein KDC69_08845 [Flavobacteriaceae bacterium]|nr:hypothetical protein [Flavobacteriaceae bacterium]